MSSSRCSPGSYDLPGARLLDLVAVMDRLRSPGGCPWDAEQTHESLTTYLVEETYETLEAIEHRRPRRTCARSSATCCCRSSSTRGSRPSTATTRGRSTTWRATSSTKLVRRHPHVFGPVTGRRRATTAADVEAGWERQKAAEKGRTSAVDGVPMALPALSLATKLVHRAEKNGVDVDPSTATTSAPG